MKMQMYKVFTENGYVMFESKAAAQVYVSFLKENNQHAVLNEWRWETEIED